MGELAASIVREVNQPMAGIVTNANAALRWLAREVPNLNETGETIRRIIRDGKRVGEIVGRMRALAKKAPPQKDWPELNQAIGEVIAIARSELQRHRVSLQTSSQMTCRSSWEIEFNCKKWFQSAGQRHRSHERSERGPARTVGKLQKVTEIPDEANEGKFASESSAGAARTHVSIAVRDSGPGLDPSALNRLFDAF